MESFTFWWEVHKFKLKFGSSVEIQTDALIKDAQDIYSQFLSNTSETEVNLPAESKEKVVKKFTDTFIFPKGYISFFSPFNS